VETRVNEKGEKICTHPGCSCLMQEEESFCSDACEQSGEGDGCPCGHPACEAHAYA